MDEKTIHRVLYDTEKSSIQVSVSIRQKTDNMSLVIIPEGIVNRTLYEFESSSTTICIRIHTIKGGNMEDYINAISYCIAETKLDIPLVIAASEGSSYLVYSNGKILRSMYCNMESLDVLMEKCLNIESTFLSRRSL